MLHVGISDPEASGGYDFNSLGNNSILRMPLNLLQYDIKNIGFGSLIDHDSL